MLTTKQAAIELNLTEGTVREYLLRKMLRGEKFGRQWAITKDEIDRYNLERLPQGRPKNQDEAIG